MIGQPNERPLLVMKKLLIFQAASEVNSELIITTMVDVVV